MRTVDCPDCGTTVRVRRDGMLYSHWVPGREGIQGCYGAQRYADDIENG